MWINKDVNLPEELLRAQREGRLVVFAGAGVSMGPPSNLPSFEKLVERLAGTALVRRPNEPFDRFLGRLEKHGVPIHALTREIIDDPASRPKAIHHDLLRLFTGPGRVRLITTNFDRHFTTAATALFPNGVDTYYAP